MRCPKCGDLSDKVIDSRELPAGDGIRRRRACDACGNRYTTYERIETTLPLVVKKDGQRVVFDRAKLTAGLFKALHRRPVSAETLHDFVRDLEQKLSAAGEREVSSAAIGDLVLAFLLKVDGVAYVRFASVYQEFRDLHEFLASMRDVAVVVQTTTAPAGDGLANDN